jgi:hypothetical protein
MKRIPLTRSFDFRVQRRAASDAAFGGALLREGIDTMLTGDIDTGKAILRDYIKATIGFAGRHDRQATQESHPPAGEKPFQRFGLSAETGRPTAACGNDGAGLRT